MAPARVARIVKARDSQFGRCRSFYGATTLAGTTPIARGFILLDKPCHCLNHYEILTSSWNWISWFLFTAVMVSFKLSTNLLFSFFTFVKADPPTVGLTSY